jgi:transposase-like protein
MTTMTAAQMRTHTGGMEQAPDPEVPERPRPPRSYPAAYKLRILGEYEQLDKAGKGALLRREGLYSSLLSEWRKQRDKGRWPGCSSAVAAHRSTRVTASWLGWSARTPGCATRSPAKPR